MARILAIDDEENLRFSIRRALTRAGHEVSEASCLKEARALVEKSDFDMILTDVMLGSENGLDYARELRKDGFDGVVVVMTAFGTVEAAVGAMRDGADDYIQKPLSLEELSIQCESWLERRRLKQRVKLYERMEQSRAAEQEVIGDSPAWNKMITMADRLARIPLGEAHEEPGLHVTPTPLPCILLSGETGVGKGVLARYIHTRAVAAERAEQNGHGATGGGGGGRGVEPAFVHVNASALPANLIEGELFGYEKGAFTDAREAKPGLFEMADGGTIFLDEIGEMPLELQAKLLLVVETGSLRRLGGRKEKRVRVRIIAASNLDLEERVEQGRFRRDLLYRLNAFTIRIPPLRDRAGDARRIAESLLDRIGRRYGRPGLKFSPAAIEAVERHSWPGNIRELSNAVQRAAMLAGGTIVEPADLMLEGTDEHDEPASHAALRASIVDAAPGTSPAAGDLRFNFTAGIHTAEEVEKALMMQALQHTGGNVSRAAKLIGMQRSSFRYRIERYDLAQYVLEAARR